MIKLILVIIFSLILSQEFITEYLVINEDTLDNFVYQLPLSLDSPAPLIVVFHQWGGSAISTIGTEFDNQAFARGWYFLSPWGGSSNNYNHQQAQYLWEQEILWMMERFNIDSKRIYMVGGSMGGASGAIYANNHLDPNKPMVAATASASGILDCERRYYEMNGNNSMTEWFGGSPEEVPFEYHRNSAVFFGDSNHSMHKNLINTPLYLDFGATEPHRGHAEDLYNLLLGEHDNMWIETSSLNGHGFPVIDEVHVCDWFSQFELVTNPNIVNVNLDEPGRAYWAEAINIENERNFIKLFVEKEFEDFMDIGYNNFTRIELNNYENSDSLLLHIIDFKVDFLQINCNYELSNLNIGITGPLINFVEYYEVSTPVLTQQFNVQNGIIWTNSDDLGFEDFVNNYRFYYSVNDINFDFIWDVTDIILTSNHILGNEILNEYQLSFADLNQDYLINIIDILFIVDLVIN
ncbi:MAG: hypothetical protein CMF96_11245 [Candidatus Marinimicrobia bacterium]|nr:hypothetical protein [Candidatus Neomarinimicrobiota bacterium]|tara:strand:+ start:6237 stop:7628 length:1392 start_codon:yes stop_codon:yes gene_type:complete